MPDFEAYAVCGVERNTDMLILIIACGAAVGKFQMPRGRKSTEIAQG